MVWQDAKNSGERPGIQSRTGAGRKSLDSAHIPHNGDCEMLEARHDHCRPNHALTGTWAGDIAALLADLKGRRYCWPSRSKAFPSTQRSHRLRPRYLHTLPAMRANKREYLFHANRSCMRCAAIRTSHLSATDRRPEEPAGCPFSGLRVQGFRVG